MAELLQDEAGRIVRGNARLMAMVEGDGLELRDGDRIWFAFVNQVSNKVLYHFGERLVERLTSGHILDLFHSLGSAGALYSVLSPYFVSFSVYNAERELGRRIGRRFGLDGADADGSAGIACFADAWPDANAFDAPDRAGKPATILSCAPKQSADGPVHWFEPVGIYSMREIPGGRLLSPPFLEILNYCSEQDFREIRALTPGPMGLAALGVARALRRPLTVTHAEAQVDTLLGSIDDLAVQEFLWHYIIWFYNQADAVRVSSPRAAALLEERGLPRGKITSDRQPDSSVAGPDPRRARNEETKPQPATAH
jgi:hypothetical protein